MQTIALLQELLFRYVLRDLPCQYFTLGANKSKCQEVLEELDVHERLRLTLELVKKEMEISKIQESIAKAIEEKISGEQRRFLLNEQLKAIKKDL
ncbi:endopeptidase La [Ranunculus cassubicifolius]